MLVVCLLVGLARAEARRLAAPAAPHRDVPTTQGVVRGYREPSPPHFAYFGVPYAATPTRSNRFESPQPPPRWDGTFEATHRVRCPQQAGGGGEENCLVLNLFVPEGASWLPVMVHFHDGGFNKGWGSHAAPRQLLQEGILVVTFNYRLGALGFLCQPAWGVAGNFGLKDQVAALYWLQRNIASFGGNPAEVTVWGTGAGAASVDFLLLSGLTEGLLHKAILESGSAVSQLFMTHDPDRAAHDGTAALQSFKYNQEKYDLETLYRKAPVRLLANISTDFMPCVERDSYSNHGLVYKEPLEILRKGNFQKVPIIYAFTDQDRNKQKNHGEAWTGAPDDFFSVFLPDNLKFDSERTRYHIKHMIINLYVDGEEENVDWAQAYSSFFNDVSTVYPMVKSAALHALYSSVPVYLLEYSYASLHVAEDTEGHPKDIYSFMFLNDLKPGGQLAAARLTTLFSNFIKFGDPTPLTSSLIPVIWQSLPTGVSTRLTTLPCLKFSQRLTMSAPTAKSLDFWDTIYERFYK